MSKKPAASRKRGAQAGAEQQAPAPQVFPEDSTDNPEELRRIVKALRRVDVCVVWDGESPSWEMTGVHCDCAGESSVRLRAVSAPPLRADAETVLRDIWDYDHDGDR